MLKCDFHIHTGEDTYDSIGYSAKTLIKLAAKYKYDVLSITNHNTVYYEDVKSYAKKHNILLIPGVEISIGLKHIVVLNCFDFDVKTFKGLEPMKNEGAFLIAPHPFFPHPTSMRMNFFMKHKHLFDALEYSYFYSKYVNFNNTAMRISKKYNIPVVANSDCHRLSNMNRNYSLIDAEKNIDSVFDAIRKNRIKLHTEPLSFKEFSKIALKIGFDSPGDIILTLKKQQKQPILKPKEQEYYR